MYYTLKELQELISQNFNCPYIRTYVCFHKQLVHAVKLVLENACMYIHVHIYIHHVHACTCTRRYILGTKNITMHH